ncbi:hypothetical protein JCM10914_1773 [Paenibacillus sp. JCM 10914]|nr:hypothetical protein JCM10914_1773 [Paenibacillus sp. JCM 10914]
MPVPFIHLTEDRRRKKWAAKEIKSKKTDENKIYSRLKRSLLANLAEAELFYEVFP